MSDDKNILTASGLCKTYKMGATNLEVLKGVDLAIRQGEFVTITGASGSGKSTLLHLLGALDKPDTGEIFYEGKSVKKFSSKMVNRYRNNQVGFVFQFYHLLDELNVLENVLMPAMAYSSTIGWMAKRSRCRARAVNLLDRMGLAERMKHRPYQLSGGERQRVAIARALINEPRILLADEPTGNLDWERGQEILSIFNELNREGQTIILVTHDYRVAQLSDRSIRLENGKIVS